MRNSYIKLKLPESLQFLQEVLLISLKVSENKDEV
jgi:hypothetical protein